MYISRSERNPLPWDLYPTPEVVHHQDPISDHPMGGFKLAFAFNEDSKQGVIGRVSSLHNYGPRIREVSIFADSYVGSIFRDRVHAYNDNPALPESGRLADQID